MQKHDAVEWIAIIATVTGSIAGFVSIAILIYGILSGQIRWVGP